MFGRKRCDCAPRDPRLLHHSAASYYIYAQGNQARCTCGWRGHVHPIGATTQYMEDARQDARDHEELYRRLQNAMTTGHES